ncbi:hypothetical protein T440DRAFT_437076 [Plenodomus tracheiphilus IPT5]|uniref:BTB domain-containing protein n=1 Tax=Plenodomus tracheiphilus IPT5 TaxID=1408161 RepID=A0A6A7ALS9_9PLEO|nr:hypothetical protein T440DRAFT_437076 [Plenodomus tracheiphilus IPT5]
MASPVAANQLSPVQIALERDCVLVVGPEKLCIPANSQILSAASKPFRAMFRPEWRDGYDMKSQVKPVDVLLPEDDATALQLLCEVIHHQNDMIPDRLPIHTVLNIAITADKYDCIQALRFASESWLRSDQHAIGDLFILAGAAYLLGNAVAFRKITKQMILTHNGSFTTISIAEVKDVIDWWTFGLLEEARSTARLDLADILVSGIDDPTGSCVHRCGWSSRYAYAYLQLLQARDLWPRALSCLSIADAIVKAETMPDPVPKEADPSCTYSYKHSVPEYRKNRQWRLANLDSKTGICLQCTKTRSENASRCQIQHQD